MNVLDSYEELGLDSWADSDDLKTAYRYLAKKYHPDRSGSAGTATKFASILSAYKVLEVNLSKNTLFRNPVKQRNPSLVCAKNDIFELGKMVTDEKDPELRKYAVRNLGFSGKKTSWIFLRRALYDPNGEVIIAAVRAVSFLSIRQSGDELALLYSRSEPEIRSRLLEIAEKSRDCLFLPLLDMAIRQGSSMEGFRARSISRSIRRASSHGQPGIP